MFRFGINSILAFLALFVSLCGLAFAQEQGRKLRVGISPFSPFVMFSDDKPIGYSIDLWKAVAEKLNIDYEFVRTKGVADKLEDLVQGKIDVAIGGITITEGREKKMDFCHSHFQTGLDILVPGDRKPSIMSFLLSFFTKTKLIVIGTICLIIIVIGHLIWLVERASESGTNSFHKKYLPGVLEGMYWTIVTASTVGYGDRVPKKWIGRLLTGVIIIIALPLGAFFVAQLSSDITLQGLRANIQGPEDLLGQRIGVVRGTTSEETVRSFGPSVRSFDSIENAHQALLDGRIDAVVYDKANLLYYAEHEGKGKVTVVGKTFAPQNYGFAVHQQNSLRETLNRALLALTERGELARINDKWFGT
jgi:ABC-type amino acid transport substrate-binding protein